MSNKYCVYLKKEKNQKDKRIHESTFEFEVELSHNTVTRVHGSK